MDGGLEDPAAASITAASAGTMQTATLWIA